MFQSLNCFVLQVFSCIRIHFRKISEYQKNVKFDFFLKFTFGCCLLKWIVHIKDVLKSEVCLLQMRGQTKRQTKPSAPMMALPNWIKKRGASSLEMDNDVHTHAKKVRYIGRCLVQPVDRIFNASYMHHFLFNKYHLLL